MTAAKPRTAKRTVEYPQAETVTTGKGMPTKRARSDRERTGAAQTFRDAAVEASLELPHERDQVTDMTADKPDPTINQASKLSVMLSGVLKTGHSAKPTGALPRCLACGAVTPKTGWLINTVVSRWTPACALRHTTALPWCRHRAPTGIATWVYWHRIRRSLLAAVGRLWCADG